MTTAIAGVLRPVPIPTSSVLRRDPAAQAFMLLRIAFTVAPILFGLDKFAEVMIGDWPKYLAPEFNDLIPGSAQDAMYIVGGVEIAAGLVVAIMPRFGGLLVAAWLGGIIVSLLLVGGYADIPEEKIVERRLLRMETIKPPAAASAMGQPYPADELLRRPSRLLYRLAYGSGSLPARRASGGGAG